MLDDRTLDALVAERVMGWTHHHEDSKDNPGWEAGVCYEGCGSEPGEWNYDEEIPHYSTTGDGMLAVIEKSGILDARIGGDLDVGFCLQRQPSGKWAVRYRYGAVIVEADTAPRAVCLAALRALGVEIPA